MPTSADRAVAATPRILAGVIVLALFGGFLFAVLPGKGISGPVARSPGDWSFLASESTCLLEFHPGAPRSVRVGCYPYRGGLYVHSHRWALVRRPFGESWAQVVAHERAVRVGLGGQVYELEATLVSDPGLRHEVLSSRGFDPVPSGIQLFRLHARR